MSCDSNYLFTYVALVLVSLSYAQNQWSGLVNMLQQDFQYQCPYDYAITGLASVFDDAVNDRRWEYQCGSGGNLANVTSTCTLQSPVHELRKDIGYQCPGDTYISGFQSSYSAADEDRHWSPYCCSRNYSTLINCHILTSNWENTLEGTLNWTTSNNRVLTGITSFFSAFNRDRRWRFRQCEIQVSCGDPGIPENAVRNGDSFLYQDVVVFTCNHGYYQSSGAEDGRRVCQDTGLWSETQPICSKCTDIENCADIRCTDAIDHYCFECESDHGVVLGESAYRNLNDSCEPLCSWLNSFCYPGVCPGGPSTCNCSEGYSGPDCLIIDKSPDLSSCVVTISSLATMCSLNSTTINYINYAPTDVSIQWDVLFLEPSLSPALRPVYVQSYGIGISRLVAEATVFRQSSFPNIPASTTQHLCNNIDVSPNNPKSPLVNCQVSITSTDIANHTFLHGDWFKVVAYTNNGGFLNITNLDENYTTTHYYTGSPIAPFSLFVIDTHPPTHCSVVLSETCLLNQEILLEDLTHNSLSIIWGGWSDDPSGIRTYELELYKLVYNSGTGLLEKEVAFDDSRLISNAGETSYSLDPEFTLDSEGPYSIILQITDNANNVQYARRIIVYDATSTLEEDNTIPLRVISGYADGNSYWHNSTTTPITVSGERHFYNTNLKTTNWLAPVANNSPPVPFEFDDDDRFGVPNALGITQLSYTYVIDQEGGNSAISMTQPSSFPHRTSDLALTSVDVYPIVKDGDSVSIWFEARDFKANPPAYEKVLVHIDSSPPVVENLGLVKEGVSGLIWLHGTNSLLDLNITFDAFDQHSGLYQLHWILETDTRVVIAQGQLPVYNYDRSTCLIDPECLCNTVTQCNKIPHPIIPISTNFISSRATVAGHDTDYYITVTATNFARLSTSLTRQLTVDLTPPLSGYVFEGPVTASNAIDIDYTTSFEFTATWSGFFDRETAVLTYQYIVDTQCATVDSFQYPNTGASPAIDTNATLIHWTASTVGKYYVTVVAYNGAYLASVPVCSDGIVIDREPPTFQGVVIPGGVVREGLVSVSGEVWFIDTHRERRLVANGACINQSTSISARELSSFPIKSNGLQPYVLPMDQCTPYVDTIYTSIDYVFNITWSVADDNGIRDYQVGIATTLNNTDNPDILPMQSTTGHTHYSTHNSLFLAGFDFYVVLKAIDLAGQISSVTLGPIVIDTSGPVSNGSLLTDVQDGIYIVSWNETDFYDDEDLFPLDRYEYSIGRNQFTSDVLSFTPVVLPSNHSLCPTPYCIVIAMEALGYLPGNQYHVTLKVTNTGNLATIVPVDPYTMPHPLTNCLSVFDYDSNEGDPFDNGNLFFSQSNDVDIIFDDTSVISVGWIGLTDAHFNGVFSVALGTEPGASDIVNYTEVTSGTTSYTFTDVSLYNGMHYYCTVQVTNSWNTVNKSSDGFLVLLIVDDDNFDAFIWDGWSNDYDIDYQLSSTVAAARWYYPESVSRYLSHYEWAVFEAVEGNRTDLSIVLPYTNNGPITHGTYPVKLSADTIYISAVRACFKSRCLPPTYSDGFQLATPPVGGNLTADYVGVGPNVGQLNIEWNPFQDPELLYYEWSVGSDKGGRELITNWSRVFPNVTSASASISFSPHTVYFVTLRGINGAGLQTNISAEVHIKQGIFDDIKVYDIDPSSVTPLYTDDYRQLSFYQMSYVDLDYTNFTDSLSAAWPDLRYKLYYYSISSTRSYIACNNGEQHWCGTTIGNSITVDHLSLINGVKYYFCVQGLADDMFSPHVLGAHSVTVCSDGIVADLSPPTGGCVQLVPSILGVGELGVLTEKDRGVYGSGERGVVEVASLVNRTHSCVARFGSQSSTSELHIVWDWFEDVEQYRNGPYAHGVSTYQYAIGTAPGSQNVIQFIDVGVVNELVVTDLSLTPGMIYYAAIKAIDHTGQSTVATSPGILIDNTPPTPRRVWLDTPTTVAVNFPHKLVPKWDLVTDRESGMVPSLYWSLGSEPGLSDLYPWSKANITELTTAESIGTLTDGQPVVLSILAMNNVGLLVTKSSHVVIYDTTPPCPSRVYDGPKPVGGSTLDLDYTSIHTHLSSHWDSFSDADTGISLYYVGIGTCVGCTDIMPFIDTRTLQTEFSRRYSCQQRQKYYTTVKGCSVYSGCVSSHSNGIVIDVTGPITSLLHHGAIESVQFQASRYTISCHWSDGFHDSESDLSHFIYYAGTSPGDDTHIPPTIVPASITSFTAHSPFSSIDLLPINRTLYVTLEVYNRAGLSHNVSSRGAFVANHAPKLNNRATFNVTWAGSLAAGTQYTNTLVRLEWNFTDTYSDVDQYFFNILSDNRSYVPIQSSYDYNTFATSLTNIQIQDGSHVSSTVIACNQVKLCTRSISDSILIDSTPPTDGYFVYKTNSIANIPWTITDGMTWHHIDSHSILNITFTGFSDPHSGVLKYWTIIGSSYGSRNLYDSISPLIIQEHPTNPLVFMATVQLSRYLYLNESVYIWLWAENGVGLESKIAQGTFKVEASDINSTDKGYLKLLRSLHCPIETCEGHCTCSKRGHYCDVSNNVSSTCRQLANSELTEDMKITITDIISQVINPDDAGVVPLFSAVSDKLVGRVQYSTEQPSFEWIEWTVSEKYNDAGFGLIDTINTPVWFPLTSKNRPIFNVNSSAYPFKQGKQYVFKARVWYNFSHYSVFETEGTTFDSHYPSIHQNFLVKELSDSTTLDVDYISTTTEVWLDWSRVFDLSLSGAYLDFQVGIGDTPGSDNVYPLTSFDNVTSLNLTGLNLKGNRKYYTLIRGTNSLGLSATTVSDGFLVDLTPPKVGMVFNGGQLYNQIAQSNNDSVTYRLLGFHDPESCIRDFVIGVAKQGETPTESTNVYVNLKPTIEGLTLEQSTYIGHITVCNIAGTCINVTSLPLIVDSSLPAISNFSDPGENLCDNGSFEDTSFAETRNTVNGWDTYGYYVMYMDNDILTMECNNQPTIASSDKYALKINRQISKTIHSVQTNTTYCVSFHVLVLRNTINRFRVKCDRKFFEPNLSQFDSDCVWKLIEFNFVPSSTTVVLSITPFGDYPIILDDFSIRSCMSISSTNYNTNTFFVNKVQTGDSLLRYSLKWPIYDLESGISEYMYAIGTVTGGIQAKGYTELIDNSIMFPELNENVIQHNAILYMSVVATNYAEQTKIFYSHSFIVDKTPPEVRGDGLIEILEENGSDVDYMGSAIVWLDWSNIIDEESGINHCLWGLGTSSGKTDVQSLTVSYFTSVNSSVLSISHGTTVYGVVYCLNNAGYTAYSVSDGVTILLDPPKHELASLRVLSPVLTWHMSQSGYVSTNSIQVVWNGFEDFSDSPLYYQLRIIESGVDLGPNEGWTDVGNLLQVTLYDLNVTNETSHKVEVRAYSVSSLISNPKSTNFSIVPSPPAWNSAIPLTVAWQTNQLSIGWQGVFQSTAPMMYEVSLGTQMGGTSIRRWASSTQENNNEGIVINDSNLNNKEQYFLAINAIGYNGRSTNANYMIDDTNVVPLESHQN